MVPTFSIAGMESEQNQYKHDEIYLRTLEHNSASHLPVESFAVSSSLRLCDLNKALSVECAS